MGRKPKLLIPAPNRGGEILQEVVGITVPVFPDKVDLENTRNRLISWLHPGVKRELDLTLPGILKKTSISTGATYVYKFNTFWVYWGLNQADILISEGHETMHSYLRQISRPNLNPYLNAFWDYSVHEGLATWAGFEVFFETEGITNLQDKLKNHKRVMETWITDPKQAKAYAFALKQVEKYLNEGATPREMIDILLDK